MKYTKSIVAFLLLNLILAFSMIFIANKTREEEKKNNNLQIGILKINEEIKINEIELIAHKNISYLKKLHNLYFSDYIENDLPNIITINQLLKKDQNIKLVKTDN